LPSGKEQDSILNVPLNPTEQNIAVAKKSSTAKLPFRRWIRVAHLWAGVGLGLWLVMLGLTGSALVYQHSLRQVLEKGRHIKPGLRPLSVGELLARIHRQRPDLIVLDIDGMDRSDSAWEFLIRPVKPARVERHSHILLVDPGTGDIGGEQTSVGTFMGVLAQLHYNLLSGEIGLTINAFAGGLAIFFAITGLVLWWRGRSKWKNGLRIKLRGVSSRVRNYSLHSAIGFYASLFLCVVGLSGIYFAAPRPFLWLGAHIEGTSLVVMKDFLDPPDSTTEPTIPDASVDRIMTAALAEFPDSRLFEVELPTAQTDAWKFHFFPHGVIDLGNAELVVVDRRSAKVLAARRTVDLPFTVRAVIFLRPLHYGSFGGNFTKVVWILLGLTPAFLFVTGLLMWRKRIAAIVAPSA
jgi:uncharacterized iron-regulated membrane protein